MPGWHYACLAGKVQGKEGKVYIENWGWESVPQLTVAPESTHPLSSSSSNESGNDAPYIPGKIYVPGWGYEPDPLYRQATGNGDGENVRIIASEVWLAPVARSATTRTSRKNRWNRA